MLLRNLPCRLRSATCRPLLLAALAVFLLSVPTAAAQDTVRLASLEVSVWPEYDQPAALVILDGQLDPSVTLPVSLAVRMPARAGQPHAVAVTGAAGDLLTAAYTTQTAGEDIIVTFQTQSLGFRVEYYDPALTIDGDARAFVFDWQTDYAIAAAEVRVQQPAGARDLAGQPALANLGPGEDGLTYYQAAWGALQPGDRATLRLTYAKTGTALTVATLGGAPAPVPQTVAPAASNDSLPWIVGGVVLGVAVGAGGWWALARSRRRVVAKAARRPRRRAGAAKQARPAPASAPARYCTQCGQPLVAGDRFCRHCGTGVAAS